jgi:hypothetical protein
MNIAKTSQALGILAISFAGISFLFEGWHGFNDPLKVLIFSCSIFVIMVVGENTINYHPTLSKILLSLCLCLMSVLGAQVGSLVISEADALTPAISEFIVVIGVFLLILTTIIWRSIHNLNSSKPIIDLAIFMFTSLVFIIPDRSSNFHGIMLGLLGISVLGSKFYSSLKALPSWADLLVRFSGVAILTGRAFMYEVDDLFYVFIYLTLFITFFLSIPFVRKKAG